MEKPQTENAPEVDKFNPIALRKAKIVCNFGLYECNRVNLHFQTAVAQAENCF